MTSDANKNVKDIGNIQDMPFEEAMAELDTIVRSLEGGHLSLQDAVDAYERGSLLKKQCEAKLLEAKLRIDMMSGDMMGGDKMVGDKTGTRPVGSE